MWLAENRQPLRARRRAKPQAPSKGEGEKTSQCGLCGKVASFVGVQWGSYVSNKLNGRAKDGLKRLQRFCKGARRQQGHQGGQRQTQGFHNGSSRAGDRRSAHGLEHPASSVDREHCGVHKHLWHRLLRAPSCTVPCETGEGFETVWTLSMGETGLPLREMTRFQQGGASKHKLHMSYDD